MTNPPDLKEFDSADNAAGTERLLLLFETDEPPDDDGGQGFDFHSLVWERRVGQEWIEVRKITRTEFEADKVTRRWVSKIGSFDAEARSAILQVAEGNAPEGSGGIRMNYSWRRWDLAENSEVEFLYDCTHEELFEPFDPERRS